MVGKKTKIENADLGKNTLADIVKRLGVGLLYGMTDLGQNDIAQIMGMGDGNVNKILKGIRKPDHRK